jgi:hypothetical protein
MLTDFRLLNGAPKITVIETFDSRAVIVRPGERLEFVSLEECKKHVEKHELEINISHIFGNSIGREIQKAKGGVS